MIIIDIEVLMKEGPELGSRQPNPDGMSIWNILKISTSNSMVLLVPERMRGTILHAWLNRASMGPINIDYHRAETSVEKASIVKLLMSQYGSMDWYVDIDPGTITETIKLGIRSLLVTSPHVIEVPPPRITWDEMVAEIDRQKALTGPKWDDE